MKSKCNRLLAGLLLLCPLFAFSQYTQYVNPFIGTGGHGHTYPGATVPFGMVQLSPDTRPDGYSDWDGCGGYHYSDSVIYGFSHTHLSGTGVADYCDVLLMPFTGEWQWNNIQNGDPKKGYASSFHHSSEKASPGFYSVHLEEDNIQAELTATARTGMHKYNFPKTNAANIILDLDHRDKLLEGSYIEIISPTKIQGLRRSSSWAKDQWVYFAIEFSQPFTNAAISDSGLIAYTGIKQFHSLISSSTDLKALFQFNSDGKNPIYVKCALSAVSCVGAWNNMKVENPGWDFDKIKKDAEITWNNALGKIEVADPEESRKGLYDPTNQMVIFYTALYHCMLAPNIYEDADGKYRGRDNLIHMADGFDYYTVFSLWDTFRGEHPLFTLIDEKRTNDFINTFLKEYQQGGRLPVWELSSNETDCMIGYHSVSVITDAAVKGIRGFDMQLALDAMKHSAEADLYGLKYYREKGFIQSNEEPESVSKTLEYAYDDWCIAQFALLLPEQTKIKFDAEDGTHKTDYDYFMARSYNYLNLVNNNLFTQPRTNGNWYAPFDPYEVNFNYTEANAWQYSFFYPQAFDKINTTQMRSTYAAALDQLFSASDKTSGRDQSDISGMIGQYAHGNEPSHHLAYFYDYLNAAYKTQKNVNEIMHAFYKNAPDGLIGNEDCGQMSAWYVLSAMGIYPVCPGSPEYAITGPSFNTIKLHTSNGNTFTITASQTGSGDFYIQRAAINDQSLNIPFIDHATITEGGNLKINLSHEPKVEWGKLPEGNQVIYPLMPPVLKCSNSSFEDTLHIFFEPMNGGEVMYSVNGNSNYKIATKGVPLIIDTSCTIRAYCINTSTGLISSTITAEYFKTHFHYQVQYITPYDHQYTAGGDKALINGQRGSVDFRTGMWQGWQGTDMEVIIDLGEKKTISSAGGGFLQDVRSWIWMPKSMEIQVSSNGKKYKTVAVVDNTIAADNYDSKEIQDLVATFRPVEARYVRIIAYNPGLIPSWHPGGGGRRWIFCDEVWVK